MHTHLESFVAQQVQLQHLLVELHAEFHGIAVLNARQFEQLVLRLRLLVVSARAAALLFYCVWLRVDDNYG